MNEWRIDDACPILLSSNFVIFLLILIMNNLNQQLNPSRSIIGKSVDQSTQKLSVYMVQRMLQRRTRAESSQHFQSISYNRIKNDIRNRSNRKIFTISYSDEKQANAETEPRNKLSEYSQLASKYNTRQVNKESENAIKQKNKYRIQTYANISETSNRKVAPVILKYMKETFKNQMSLMNSNEMEEQVGELYGLNIQQVRTYKILSKKQRFKIKNLSYDDSEQKPAKSVTTYANQSSQGEKNSPTKGGGFNAMAIKKNYKSKQLIEDFNHEFLKSIIYKKESFPQNLNKSKQKKQNVSIHDLKFIKMMNCLDIILNSFHLNIQKSTRRFNSITSIPKDQPEDAKQQTSEKFTYFVGNGNNAQLIRSIMKKRGWWIETNHPLKANFVWSQLKIKKVLNRQSTCSSENPTIFYYENDVKRDIASNLLKRSPKLSICHEQQDQSSLNVKQSAYSLIFHEKHCSKYYYPLSEAERKLRLKSICHPQLYHNHFEFNHMIGNKNALYFNLRLYYQFAKKNLAEIVPLTYYLEANEERGLQQFQKKFEAAQNAIWILKPGQNSNRGQRITLAKSLDEIKSRLGVERKLIVQSYIKNLFLYNGRKFDIRTYLLGLNMHGRLKFYFYQEGYIKTSSFLYNLKNINDKYIHLTNDAIQQTSEKYGKYEEGNKLSYGQFQRHLDNKYQKDNYDVCRLHQLMRKQASQVVRSTYHKLNSNRKSCCFELFGLDFLVDSNFKPYLIQVNTNPCLELCSHSLERLIPRMVENLFRMSLDPLFRPQLIHNTKSESYYFYDEQFLQKNQFRLIFDEKFDRNIEWERFSSQSERQKCCHFEAQEADEDNLPLEK